jgi:hypothetical protein
MSGRSVVVSPHLQRGMVSGWKSGRKNRKVILIRQFPGSNVSSGRSGGAGCGGWKRSIVLRGGIECLKRSCVDACIIQSCKRDALVNECNLSRTKYTNRIMRKGDIECLSSPLPGFIKRDNFPKAEHSPGACRSHRTIGQQYQHQPLRTQTKACDGWIGTYASQAV